MDAAHLAIATSHVDSFLASLNQGLEDKLDGLVEELLYECTMLAVSEPG